MYGLRAAFVTMVHDLNERTQAEGACCLLMSKSFTASEQDYEPSLAVLYATIEISILPLGRFQQSMT